MRFKIIHQFAVCSVLLVILLARSAECVGYCTPHSSAGKAPPQLANTFQAKMEMKDLMKNSTTEIEIWNEFEQNLTKIKVLMEAVEYDFYYSFVTQEIYAIQGGTEQCKVVNMSMGGDLDIIVGKNVSGVIVQEETQSLFRLDQQYGIKFVSDNETVRGIPAERWSSCQSWPSRKAEFEVNWYFSKANWNSISSASVPLRIEVRGISNVSLTPNRELHLIYDFVFFRPYLQDSQRVFQTPRGVFCDRRVQTKKLPELHPILIFTWEIVKGKREMVSNVYYGKINYDSTQEILRYDYREPGSIIKPPFYNLGTLTIVQDYQSGVAYFIDQVYGNCTARPIGTELLDLSNLDPNEVPEWSTVVMRNPKFVFQFDDSFQYEGKAMVRGLPVDVFISLKQIAVNSQPMNVTFEYYILDESVTEIAIGGAGKIGKGQTIPVQLLVASYSELGPDAEPGFTYYERFNFFNFDSPDLEANPDANLDVAQPFNFDIGFCYKQEEQMHFMMKLKPDRDSIETQQLLNEVDLIIRSTVDQLGKADLGLVNRIRFQYPKLDLDDQFVYFMTTLLDKPDVYYQYIRSNYKNPSILSIDSSETAATEKDCLESCYRNGDCRSVGYCSGPNLPNGKNCLMSKQFGFEKNTQAYSCSVFGSPINSSNSIVELSLQEAYQQISIAVENKQFIVPIMGLTNQLKFNLIASSIENYTIRPDVFNPLTGRHLIRFDSIPQTSFNFANSKLRNRQVLNKISADECARTCLDELEFDCNSAVYCYDLGLCHVTEELPNQDKTNLLARARCNVYTKNSLSQFTQYPGESRIFVKGKNPIGEVNSPADCAKLCLNPTAQNITCRSFDLCQFSDQKQLCYLDSGHMTDSNSVGVNRTECQHFSLSYSADFAKSVTVTDPELTDLRLIAQVTGQQCARICVEEVGAVCQGYYYCAASNECALMQVGDERPGTDSAAGRRCDYMKRLYNTDGTLYQYTKPQAVAGGTKGISVAAAVLIYIATAVIGLLIGVIGFVAIQNFRGDSVWRDLKAFFTWR